MLLVLPGLELAEEASPEQGVIPLHRLLKKNVVVAKKTVKKSKF
jgi:hypothetical protein